MGGVPSAADMRRSYRLVRAMGGAERCNSFTKFFFVFLGQSSHDACPAIPPEIVLLPKRLYFNLYHVSAWTRTMILPLGMVTTMRPVRQLPPHLRIDELYVDKIAADRLADPVPGRPSNWRQFFP